jgi:hypothetical protein
MMTKCRFYVDDKRNCTSKFNLDIAQKEWSKSDCYGLIGHPFPFEMNNGLWSHRTDHSLTVVTTEGHVLYWRDVTEPSLTLSHLTQ